MGPSPFSHPMFLTENKFEVPVQYAVVSMTIGGRVLAVTRLYVFTSAAPRHVLLTASFSKIRI